MCCLVGGTGSGKSYTALSLAEQLSNDFDIDAVVFDPEDFFKYINSKKRKRGDIIVIDEAGVAASARKWQSDYNIMLMYVLQTFRHRGYVVFFCVPDIGFIDKQARKLMHGLFEVMGVDFYKNVTRVKPLMIQHNPRYGKSYHKYLRISNGYGKKVPVNRILVKKPSKELIEKYERKKTNYTSKLNRELMDKVSTNTTKHNMQLKCNQCSHVWTTLYPRPSKRCPKCMTMRWNQPKVLETKDDMMAVA